MKHMLVVMIALFILTACGGGSDSGGNSPSTPNNNTNNNFIRLSPVVTTDNLALYGSLSAQQGESVGFAITSADNKSLSEVTWMQLSGPTVTFLASHTQAIGFDVTQAGIYEFQVSAQTVNGENRSLHFSLDVTPSEQAEVNIRVDHAATEFGRVSVRLDTSVMKIVTSIDWQQSAGPEISNPVYQGDTDTSPANSVFFSAPEVTADELIELTATVTFDDGTNATDNILILVKNSTINENGFFPSNDLFVTSDMIPANPNSPYVSALQRCVYNNRLSASCDFDSLPLIGQKTSNPTLDDILNRTLVSHPWMASRFKEYLTQSAAAGDMLKLLRGVTAIVISYDIRPSFYWSATGAIYLDANNFWRTAQERDTVNTAPDYRSDFGNDLTFGIYWRYVKDGRYYFPQAGLAPSLRNNRDFTKLDAALSWLLYHELAHANDFFPPSRWSSISLSTSPLAYSRNQAPNSPGLTDNYPLTSALLADLAQVSFGGSVATLAQQQVTPDDAANEFKTDIAPSFYSYYTEREDYATLFERFMMLYRLNVSADVGVIGSKSNPDALVTWGQRDRINDPDLQARTAYVVNRVFPDIDAVAIQAQLPSPILLPAGESWFDVVDLNSAIEPSPSALRNGQYNTPAPALLHHHFEATLTVPRNAYE